MLQLQHMYTGELDTQIGCASGSASNTRGSHHEATQRRHPALLYTHLVLLTLLLERACEVTVGLSVALICPL